VGVCLIVEALFKNGIPLIVGNVTGALTLLIAHFLSTSGDTMEMMQAVLDTNFWLATHVTCITLGYTACFVAASRGLPTSSWGCSRTRWPGKTGRRCPRRFTAWCASACS